MQKIPEYPRLQMDLAQIKESNVLGTERTLAVLIEFSQRLEPLLHSHKGNLIKSNLRIDVSNGKAYHYQKGYQQNIVDKEVIAGILTREEIELINERALPEISAKRDQAWFEKAEKVWWMEHEGMIASSHSEIVCDVQEFVDNYDLDNEDLPLFVWALDPKPVITFDPANIIDNCEWPECYDEDDLKGQTEFREACNAFMAANSHMLVYHEDHKLAVVFDKTLMPKLNGQSESK